jgi:hypothetical protein
LVVEGMVKVEGMVEEVGMVGVEGLGEVEAAVPCCHLGTDTTARLG